MPPKEPDLSDWLVRSCFDADESELSFPGRGKIKITAESVNHILGLPMKGDKVVYDIDVQAINFIHEKYKIDDGLAPRISEIVSRVQANKEANEDFLRSWLMVAISTFLCPSTCLSISPRCYSSLVDLSAVKKLNWSQFVVDQLRNSGTKMNKRNSVKGCLFFLVVLYLDSLMLPNDVIIDLCSPRVGAWSKDLVEQVIKLDMNRKGSFGNLKFKKSSHTIVQTSIFKNMDEIEGFIASKLSANCSQQRKRKLAEAVTKVCTSVTNILGTFIQEVSEIPDSDEPRAVRSKLNRSQVDEHDFIHDQSSEGASEDADYLADEEEEEFVEMTDTDEDVELQDNDVAEDDQDKGKHGDQLDDGSESDAEDDTNLDKELEANEEDAEFHSPKQEEKVDPQGQLKNHVQIPQSDGGKQIVENSIALATVPPNVPSNSKRRYDQQYGLSAKGRKKARRERLKLPDTNQVYKIFQHGPVGAAEQANESKEGESPGPKDAEEQGCSLKETTAADKHLSATNTPSNLVKVNSWDYPAPDCDLLKFLDDNEGPGESVKGIADSGSMADQKDIPG